MSALGPVLSVVGAFPKSGAEGYGQWNMMLAAS
jgi:hypothetical protein